MSYKAKPTTKAQFKKAIAGFQLLEKQFNQLKEQNELELKTVQAIKYNYRTGVDHAKIKLLLARRKAFKEMSKGLNSVVYSLGMMDNLV